MTDTDPYNIPQHTPGAKLDGSKPDCELVFSGFAEALLDVAKVGTYGAHKYTAQGWMQVPDGAHRYRSAAFRHMLAATTRDQESGLPHLAHAAWCMLAALQLEQYTPND